MILFLATFYNSETVVQLLLERPGVDLVSMARDIQSLCYARDGEADRILQLLEEAKARIVLLSNLRSSSIRRIFVELGANRTLL